MTETYIEDALQALRISRRYAGRRQLAEAVRLALEDDSRLLRMDRQIFGPTAALCGGTSGSVARNIRTVACRTWTQHPELLRQMAGLPLDGPPTASELVEILLTHIQRTRRQARR